MVNVTRICKYCGEEYKPGPRHPGLITVCLLTECQEKAAADGVREPAMKTAAVYWEGKHTPVVEVVDFPALAARVNGLQRRHGASVMQSMTAGGPKPLTRKIEAGIEPKEKEYKWEPGAVWRSSLGEAHSRKR